MPREEHRQKSRARDEDGEQEAADLSDFDSPSPGCRQSPTLTIAKITSRYRTNPAEPQSSLRLSIANTTDGG
jgi:hypothetical protein